MPRISSHVDTLFVIGREDFQAAHSVTALCGADDSLFGMPYQSQNETQDKSIFRCERLKRSDRWNL